MIYDDATQGYAPCHIKKLISIIFKEYIKGNVCMKILVFSDSHGRQQNIKKALEYHPDAQYIFHLGDGLRDMEGLEPLCVGKELLQVNGNHEDAFFTFSSNPSVLCAEVCGKKIYICHGHRNSVKNTKYYLMDSACKNDADIVLFGHTHTRYYEYLPPDSLSKILVDRSSGNSKYTRDKGLYIFNPGSISLPRDSKPASYGIIEIKENGVLFSHGNI